MKAMVRILSVGFLIIMVHSLFAQRKISGTVFMNGQPAAGILVEAQRTNDSYYTSFDGKFEIEIHEKSKFLKFTFLDESKKYDITAETGDVINFSFDGSEIPEMSDEPGVILKDFETLQKERDMDFLNNWSLYKEFLKQDDIKSAIPHWRTLYHLYPKSTPTIYIDGIKIYETFMDKALDTHTKMLYLDTIMSIYDKRIKYMDNIGELMGRKAKKYLESILTLDLMEDEMIEGVKKGYGFAEKSVQESGSLTEPAVIVLLMQSTRKLYSYDEINKSVVLENYEKTMSILEEQLKNADLKDKAEQAIPLVEQIIEGSGALDCTALSELYAPKFKSNPHDIELIKKIVRMLRKENCTDSDLYTKASEKLYALEPSPEAAFNMANMFVKKNNFDKAFGYYEKAYTDEPDPVTKASYYYYAGMLALQRGKIQEARNLAREAVKNNPEYCEAFMLLGEIFAQASKDFGNDDFEHSTVFWLAVDYFNKAARVGNCPDAANKANFYMNYFPGKEEVFFRELSEGNSHYLGGWINETTTVRVKK
ncbi:MAG TPA: tetratricopeptide repeat protein [Prolixibacteraceae bacterium]|nr:tetratricopeptide repeat protein [Prolixibacteraceae bacterium]